MNEISMGSFGEQTLDALLDAESSSNVKKKSQNSGTTRNLRCKKPFFAPLQEIDENLITDNLVKNVTPVQNTSEKVTQHDDTNIDKYFQDSIFLSKIRTSRSQNKENLLDGNITSTEKTKISLTKVTSRNNKYLRSTKARSLKKDVIKTSKFQQDDIKLSEELFMSECSEDDSSNKLSSPPQQINLTTNNVEDLGRTNTSKHTAVINSNTITDSCNQSLMVSIQDRCRLSAWGLPSDILQKYELRGMAVMFPWQAECLSNYQVLEENKNLVYSAPTSAGKTLVAELLVVKTVLERQKKVIVILPFVSVVREKMFYFQDLLSSSGIRVEGFMGGIAPAGGFAATHIAIATIEKANSLVNRLMEEGSLSSLGAVVVDELHLLGDAHRGYLLELLLTKLKYMTLREEHVKIQLIGMSATLPNLSLLAEWLDAELFNTEFRPVPLNEQYKVNTTIYDNKFGPIRELSPLPELPNDSDHILQLCIETIAAGHSTLIFCPTKNWCEKLAHQIAAIFFKLGSGETALGKILREQLNSNAIEETLSQLKRCPSGLDNVLKSTVSFGIAFHHAGLTMDERDIIEGSFRTGSLRVLIATSTLSSGVNLPARRVIIRSLMFHGKVIDTLTYRQMIGRAGRMGKDTAGESILICKPNEKSAAESLLSAPLDPVKSCLEGSGPLIRALLEAVASEVACTPSNIDLYSRCTLASFHPDNKVGSLTKEAMEFLTLNEFILVQETKEKEQRWVATALGKACLASSVSPKDGLFLFEELQRARKCFVLETELHIIYLVTPFNSGSLNGQINWMIFFNLWKSLSECERRVGQMVGIEERFLMSAIKGIVKHGKQQDIHRRFFTALALHDLVREIPLSTVSEKYGCSRGVLQSLQQSASTFAGMVTQFCKQLGWDCMELLFCQFQTRLQFGVCRELLDLLRLPMLNGLRARSLYKEGIKCVADLATADELDVERALHNALPFESEKEQDGEHMLDAAKRNKVRSIFVTGRDGLTPYQAAVLLVQEARTLVQNELGVKEVHWKPDNTGSSSIHITKSFNKRFSSIVQPPNPSVTSNQIVINSPISSKDSTLKSVTNDLSNVVQQMEHCANGKAVPVVISKPMSSSVKGHVEKKIEHYEMISDLLSEAIDPVTDLQEEIAQIDSCHDNIARRENGSNKNMKNKSKFNLLITKRKSPRIKNTAVSTPNDNFKQVFNEPVITLSPQITCDSLISLGDIDETSVIKGGKDRFLSNGSNLDIKGHLLKTKLHADSGSIGNIVIKKQGPSKIVTLDSKLSISPVVTLRRLSVVEDMSNETPNNSTKLLEVKTFSEHHQKKSTDNDKMKTSLSESPSLFGDSLCLDTQFCDELEKNLNNSLDISKIKNPESSTIDRSSTSLQKSIVQLENNGPSPKVILGQITNNSKNKFLFGTDIEHNNRITRSHEPKCSDLNNQILNSEEINFSWNSTTWDDLKDSRNSSDLLNNACNEVMHQVIEEKGSSKVKTRNWMLPNDFELSSEIAATPVMQNNCFKSVSSKSTIQSVKNVKLLDDSDSRKRKFNEINSMSDSSPILNVTNRRLSFGSNKSDSDDLIAASQSLEPIKGTNKSRTRLKLELSKRVSINKRQSNLTLTESGRQSNIIKNKNIELLRTGDESIKKVLYQENCSTDSIVSNSDEDSPVRRLRVSQSLHKRSLNSSFIARKIENLRKCKKRCLRSNVNEEKLNSDQTLDWNILDIINVTWNEKIFKLFSTEVKQKNEIAIALASDKFINDTAGIGSKLVGFSSSDMKKKCRKNESCVYSNIIVNGIAICWGRNVVYYMSLENRNEGSIAFKERLQLLEDILTNSFLNVRCYGSKDIYKKLHQCCNITCNCKFLDPQVADWLLQPEMSERDLYEMAKIYFPQGTAILQHANLAKTVANASSENKNFLLARHRAAAEAVVTWHVVGKLTEKLHVQSEILLNAFKDVESEVSPALARMELTGIGINLESLQELSAVLQREMSALEQQAYFLAGRKFSFTSSKEVAQVLGMYKGVKVSTNKAVLESCNNPISNLIMSWRKLNTTQTKMVFPLLNLAQQGPRIRGSCVTHTATGRISMHEPNLQNVPRDFNSENNSFVISMRMAFVPTFGNIMLSADYCQLELRILAHFSKDPVLCEIMKKDSDIFKNIAAQWNYISIREVTDEIRQRTKQLCYGIIYGIGSKTLAKQLSVTELEATKFMETFMGTYPNVSSWLNEVVTQSRENGYVMTLMERPRFLPGLNSEDKRERSQAERQAVNTKIQGSAADIAKKAMVLIDQKLHEEYPDSPRVLAETKNRKLRSSRDSQNRGACLVLQLHDELLYEVNAMDLDRVAAIVKTSMEEAYRLTIPLPVKIKVGPTWGSLTEYTVGESN